MNFSSESVADPVNRAIFGGSFDPVHLGHMGMLRAVLERLAVKFVDVVPCYVSPFKEGTVATGEQRYEMLQLAIEDVGFTEVTVSRHEIDRPEASFSWETVAHFKKLDPDATWHWILGTDQWNAIEKWAKPDYLRDHLSFIVLTRNGQEVAERKGWDHVAVEFEHKASATAIRTDFEAYSHWLPPSVVEYCREHALYGAGGRS